MAKNLSTSKIPYSSDNAAPVTSFTPQPIRKNSDPEQRKLNFKKPLSPQKEDKKKDIILGTRKTTEDLLTASINEITPRTEFVTAKPSKKQQYVNNKFLQRSDENIIELDLSITVPGAKHHEQTANNSCRKLFGEVEDLLVEIMEELKD
jgi:hypothetical protein